MFAQGLWLLLAVLSLLAIGFGIVLLRSGRIASTSVHPSVSRAVMLRNGPGTGSSWLPESGGASSARDPEPESDPAPTPEPSQQPAAAGHTGYAMFNMSHEERARLLAAARSGSPNDPGVAELVPATRAGLIRGYVRDSGGGVVSGASLTLIDGGGQIGHAITGGDGSYSMLTPRPGSYFLIARAKGHHPHASTVTVTDQPVSLKIVLTGLAELSGVVRVAGSHGPVSNAVLTLLDPRGEVIASVVSDPHGRYRFPDLVGGTYTLATTAMPFQPAAQVVTVSDTGVSSRDVDLTGGAVVHGTAWGGADRRILPDARVMLLDDAGNVAAVTRTDASGEYLFSDVPEGNYTLTASGYPAVTASIEIRSGQRHQHDVELRHPDD